MPALLLVFGIGTGARTIAREEETGTVDLLDTIAPLVDSLDGWQSLSPFAWYAGDEVLTRGIELADVALLAGSSAVLVVAAVIAGERRDLAV